MKYSEERLGGRKQKICRMEMDGDMNIIMCCFSLKEGCDWVLFLKICIVDF